MKQVVNDVQKVMHNPTKDLPIVLVAMRDCIPMYKNLQSAKNVRKVDINTTPSKITVSNVNWVLHNPTKDLRIVLVVRQVRIAMLLNHRHVSNVQ